MRVHGNRIRKYEEEFGPLVIEELANPENFLALQLYDTLQPNERLVVQ